MTEHASTLGVLDWGVGGLGVVHALRQQGVRNPIVYLSDTGVTAYGRLTPAHLARRVEQVVAELHARGAHRVLIACNAASTVTDRLRSAIPVTGVIEPALRALYASDAATFGVIGGARTIRSGIYRCGLSRPGRVVMQRIAQPLSAHIEFRTLHTAAARRDLQRILQPLRDVDVLVLACTHYPAIIERIRPHAPRARMFDPATAVAADLTSHFATAGGDCELRALTTGDPRTMRTAALDAWGVDPGRCARIDI